MGRTAAQVDRALQREPQRSTTRNLQIPRSYRPQRPCSDSARSQALDSMFCWCRVAQPRQAPVATRRRAFYLLSSPQAQRSACLEADWRSLESEGREAIHRFVQSGASAGAYSSMRSVPQFDSCRKCAIACYCDLLFRGGGYCGICAGAFLAHRLRLVITRRCHISSG